MSEVAHIPQLRFPEFDGVWESGLLKDAVKINPRSGELPDEFIYIDLESVKKGYLIKGTQINKIGAPSRAQRLLNKNDVIFQTVRPYQKNNYFFNLDGDYVASTGYAQLRVLNSPEFLYQALHTDRFVYDVMARSTGTSYPAINSTDLSKIKLNLPTKLEQQKIASFLTAVDNKIEKLSKKQALLGEYKKGLMQQIFSQAIRFKADDGSTFPDWEENTIDKAIHSYKLGGNYSNSEAVTDYPLIKMGNLDRGNIKLNKLQYINTEENIDDSDKINYGDLFFNTRNTLDLVGKVAIWRDELPCAYYNSNLMKMEFSDNFFMNYRFNSFDGIKALRRVATGTTSVAAIYTKDLLKIKFSLPTLSEQQKIANFLSSIDNKIEQVGKQLDESKQFKKALLQQMFV